MMTEQILKQIDDLSSDKMIATNSGTFGAEECCRAVGSGDPKFGEWTTYERLDGTRYTTGTNPGTAPGYARRFAPDSAAARRAKIAALKATLQASETAERQQESQRDALARGWDGYQFVGIEEGQRRLAAQ